MPWSENGMGKGVTKDVGTSPKTPGKRRRVRGSRQQRKSTYGKGRTTTSQIIKGERSALKAEIGRSGEIRTPDPLVPNQMRYQAALHSEPLVRRGYTIHSPPATVNMPALPLQADFPLRPTNCGPYCPLFIAGWRLVLTTDAVSPVIWDQSCAQRNAETVCMQRFFSSTCGIWLECSKSTHRQSGTRST